jgi:hypothetical protein
LLESETFGPPPAATAAAEGDADAVVAAVTTVANAS